MAIAEWAPERGRPTFSFYVTAHHCRQKPQIVEAAAHRATEFLNECRSATEWYGLAGFKGPEKPKAQLTGWVLS